jgi:hypothetical protein
VNLPLKNIGALALEHGQDALDQLGIAQPVRVHHALHPLLRHGANALVLGNLQQSQALGRLVVTRSTRRLGQKTRVHQGHTAHALRGQTQHLQRHTGAHGMPRHHKLRWG